VSIVKNATKAVVIGCGATATMDLVGEVIRRATGVEPLNLSMVGRWIGHFKNGKFKHEAIGRSEPIKGEKAMGWAAHYAIGTSFAAALLAVSPSWRAKPTLSPALGVGLLTTAAPWFLMQPAFGIGVAASKTPDPMTARLRSLRAHAFYGFGLYISGLAFEKLTDPSMS
jgi:hypothetical protein